MGLASVVTEALCSLDHSAVDRKLITVFVLLGHFSALAAPFEWASSSPEHQGLSSSALASFRQSLAEHSTKALLIIRNDRIVQEWYAAGHSATQTHYTASMAKALVGGMS